MRKTKNQTFTVWFPCCTCEVLNIHDFDLFSQQSDEENCYYLDFADEKTEAQEFPWWRSG